MDTIDAEIKAKIIFKKAFGAALLLEMFFLFLVGIGHSWVGPRKIDTDGQFLQAEIVDAPKEAKLFKDKPVSEPVKKEAVLSKVANQGRQAKPEEKNLDTNNKTESGRTLFPTHGPVVLYSPRPVIPSYLREKELKTSVVIDFFVTKSGEATTRLVGSSGNEELDALALRTAAAWRFQAAENNHQAVDAKIRLRILFEVN